MAEHTKLATKAPEPQREHAPSQTRKPESSQSMDSPLNRILHLQKTVGNRAVQRMIRTGVLQAKLRIGQPNDIYEQEADRIADQVMRMPDIQRSPVCFSCGEREEEKPIQTKPLAGRITPLVQRQVGSEEEEEEPIQAKLVDGVQIQRQEEEPEEEEEEAIQPKPLAEQITPLIQRQPEEEPEEEEEEGTLQSKPLAEQISPLIQRQPEEEPEEEEEEGEEPIQTKQAGGKTPHVSRGLAAQIHSLKGGGQPLPQSAHNFFEPLFGYDFSRVRVHTNEQAAKAARAANATAFTVGRDIVFRSGQYSPNTSSGKRLLAHELTHVIQQTETGQKKKCNRAKNTSWFGAVNASRILQRRENRPRQRAVIPKLPASATLITGLNLIELKVGEVKNHINFISNYLEEVIALSAGHAVNKKALRDNVRDVKKAIKKENFDKFIGSLTDLFFSLPSLVGAAAKLAKVAVIVGTIESGRKISAIIGTEASDSRTKLLRGQKLVFKALDFALEILKRMQLIHLRFHIDQMKVKLKYISEQINLTASVIVKAHRLGTRYPASVMQKTKRVLSTAQKALYTISSRAYEYGTLLKAFKKAGGHPLRRGTRGRQWFNIFYRLSRRNMLRAFTLLRFRIISYRGWAQREKVHVFRTSPIRYEVQWLHGTRLPYIRDVYFITKRRLSMGRSLGRAFSVLRGWRRRPAYTYYKHSLFQRGGVLVPFFRQQKWWQTPGFWAFVRKSLHLSYRLVPYKYKSMGRYIYIRTSWSKDALKL